MWTRFGLLCFLVGAPLISANRAAHLTMMVSKDESATATSGSSATVGTVSAADTSSSSAGTVGTTTTTTSSSSSSSGWHMTAVTSVQARVQGDAPVWNEDAQLWLSKYGDTTELAYMNNLDTVNTASVEGALMYVQAEGINVNEQSVKCERKNSMQYVVFYELTIVQPTYGINDACASAQNGCNRTLYSQICAVCESAADGCEAAPSSFSFPTLTLPSNSSSDGTSDSTTAGSSSSPVTASLASALVGLAAVVASSLL
ncbi:hypothetical protein PRNP1_001417 [Phytophthora ramorum]